jgi:hypothetical protein
MEKYLLRMFQAQVERQCRYVLMAAAIAKDGFANARVDPIWFGLEALLNASANISNACWGANGKLSIQREPLRSSLSIDDSSPFKATAVRNHFQHYDERLDRWWRDSPNHNHIDQIVGDPFPPGSMSSGSATSTCSDTRIGPCLRSSSGETPST